jgi:putative FmdB family regulatory protein
MPLYEYECETCGHRFEVIQKFSDAPIDTCPKCGGKVKKLISSPAIQFKGTGWYITDYAKKSTSDAGKTGSMSNESKSSTDTKSDSSSASSETTKSDSSAKKD